MPDAARVVSPSGRQTEISYDAQRATVVEVGGGVRAYRVGGEAVLEGYALDAMCDGARGQPLIPWPNRLADGRYSWQGHEHQVPLTEPAQDNAIHGFTRWRNWELRQAAADRAVLELLLHPRPGWPFTLDLVVGYVLGPDGLTVTTTATNVGTVVAPYGHGAHPYLTVGTARIDPCLARIPGATRIVTDARQIPTGREPVEGTDFDFRATRRLGDLAIDHAFTDLERDEHGLARVSLSDPEGSRTTTLWMDEHYPYVEIFTGDALAPGRRRTGLGVEPMTCPPNALQSGTDVLAIEPGQSVTTRWGITFSPR